MSDTSWAQRGFGPTDKYKGETGVAYLLHNLSQGFLGLVGLGVCAMVQKFDVPDRVSDNQRVGIGSLQSWFDVFTSSHYLVLAWRLGCNASGYRLYYLVGITICCLFIHAPPNGRRSPYQRTREWNTAPGQSDWLRDARSIWKCHLQRQTSAVQLEIHKLGFQCAHLSTERTDRPS